MDGQVSYSDVAAMCKSNDGCGMNNWMNNPLTK